MSRIEKMPVSEILDYIGLNLTSEDFKIIVDYDQEAISRLYEEIKNNQNRVKINTTFDKTRPWIGKETQQDDAESLLDELNIKTFRDVLIEYESKIDKEILVLLSLYNVQKSIENDSFETFQVDREALKKSRTRAMSLLGKKDVNVISIGYDKIENKVERVNVVNSKELIGCIKGNQKLSTLSNPEKKKIARLEEIDKNIGLGNVAHAINALDLRDIICQNKDIGEAVLQQIYYNFLHKYQEKHPEIDYTKMLKDGEVPQEIQYEMLQSKEYNEAIIQAIRSNYKYIDLDKLLLCSAFRYIQILEEGKENEVFAKVVGDNNKHNLTQIQMLQVLIETITKGIKKDISVECVYNDKNHKVRYSLETLKKDLDRFAKDRYIKRSDCESTKQKLLSGEITFKDVDLNETYFIRINDEDIKNILKASDDNMDFFIEKDFFVKEKMHDILVELGGCSKEIFAKIVKKNLVAPQDIEELFDEGIIGVEYIKAIENDEIKRSIDITDKLRNLYMTVSNAEKEATPEEREQFIKYVELYKALNIETRSEEEIKNASFNLISSFEDGLDSGVLEGLYQYGLITLEDAADWGVDLREMLSNNSIKPTDLKDLYAKRIIDIDSIRNVIVNNNDLPYEDKLDLIYSTFDGESEEEYAIREELVQLLEEKDSYRAESNGTRANQTRQSKVKSREYVTDPHSRWKLISLLDKDYSKKFLPTGKEVRDGHRVFLLPNQNSIVIERMHERKKGRKVSAYANATYIMQTEEFFKNMDEIIIDGAINRSMLRELSEYDKATKIIHSKGWGASIKKYFGIEGENEKYTKQDIEEIDKAIESVNKSRKERT